MGQIAVYEWFRKRRETGDDEFYTIQEVRKALADEGESLSYRQANVAVWQLFRYGYLERRDPKSLRDWLVSFRLKRNNSKKPP